MYINKPWKSKPTKLYPLVNLLNPWIILQDQPLLFCLGFLKQIYIHKIHQPIVFTQKTTFKRDPFKPLNKRQMSSRVSWKGPWGEVFLGHIDPSNRLGVSRIPVMAVPCTIFAGIWVGSLILFFDNGLQAWNIYISYISINVITY